MDEFLRRIEPHINGMRTLIAIRMRGTGLAEDLLQETLLAAWLHRDAVRDGDALRPWLFEIARNKCSDAYRRLRREVPMQSEMIDAHIGARGRDPQHEPWDIAEAMARLPEHERDIARRHYLDDAALRDIAEDARLPLGTVKRRLHDARARMRAYLREEPDGKGRVCMNAKCPLPAFRPDIAIAALDEPAFEVACPEALWMGESMRVGDTIWWGIYDAPDWHLANAYRTETLRAARVHGVDGVEVRVQAHDIDEDRREERFVYIGVVEGGVKTLAARIEEGDRVAYESFLDPAFDDNWNSGLPMRMRDEGRFERIGEAAYRTAKPEASIGAGLYRVTIGGKAHRCLRVLDAQDGMLIEGFLLEDGHTALDRRYNDAMWKVGPGQRYDTPWNERFPDHARIEIDGVTYVHWYDCVSAAAL